MKKVLLSLIFLIFIISHTFSQAPLVKQWDNRFGGGDYDYLFSLGQTNDGGFILGGYSGSDSTLDVSQSSQGMSDYWIVKTDSFGNKLWDKLFGGTLFEWFHSLRQTTDRGYILGGTTASPNSGDISQISRGGSDYWILKTDSMGTKQWDKRFGGGGGDELRSLQQTTDGGYIIGGWTTSGNGGDVTQPPLGGSDYWIVKTDSMGNKLWDKRFGGNLTEMLNSIQQTSDGGYILGGSTTSGNINHVSQPSQGGVDFWIVKTNLAGAKQWDKRFGGTGDEEMLSSQQTLDAGYILGGWTTSDSGGDVSEPSRGFRDYWIVKTDSLGNKQWDKRFGGSGYDWLYTLQQTVDGGYLLSGESFSNVSGDKSENNLGLKQTWIVKTDSLGNKLWDKTVFTLGPYDGNGCSIQTTDGCYVAANYTQAGAGGYITHLSRGDYDYWMVKFCDSTLVTKITTASLNSEEGIKVFPNPTRQELTVNFYSSTGTGLLKVLDVLGKELYSSGNISSGFRLPTANLQPGIYFLEVLTAQKRFFTKFVKE